ncbi:C-C motif chemokine 4, partial [Clarias magur]
PNEPTACCLKFTKNKIPLNLITGYKNTQHGCTTPGIIFTMKSGRRVCADPGVEWVQEHMAKVDLRKASHHYRQLRSCPLILDN